MRVTLSSLLLVATASAAATHGTYENHARAATVDVSTLKGKWLYGYQGWFLSQPLVSTTTGLPTVALQGLAMVGSITSCI